MPPDPSLAWPVPRCDAHGIRSQRLINHNCFNSINDVFRGRSERVNQVSVFVGVFLIVMAGPARGRNRRARLFRAALPCLALIALTGTAAQAQTVTSDLFSPTRTSQVTSPDLPLRRTAAETNDPLNSPKLQDNDKDKPAPSRIGQIPKYGLPAASGAANFRLRLAQPQAQETEILSGAGEAESRRSVPAVRRRRSRRTRGCGFRFRRRRSANKTPHPARDGGHGGGAAAAQAPQDRRRSVRRGRRLRRQFPDQIRRRTLRRLRHQSRRASCRADKPFYVIAPEFVAFSDWERHALVADLRGSFTGYSNNFPPNADGTPLSAPLDIDRPNFIGHVDGRLDVSRDTRLLGAGAVVRLDRQSRQPERAGRPRQISDLHHGRRHPWRRSELQPPAGFRRRHRRPHRLSPTQSSPTAPRPPTTTATSTSTAASAASATI